MGGTEELFRLKVILGYIGRQLGISLDFLRPCLKIDKQKEKNELGVYVTGKPLRFPC